MLTVTSMKDNGLTIKLTEKVHIHMPMGPIITVIGLMINSMVLVWSHGLMELSMKGTILMERKKERES